MEEALVLPFCVYSRESTREQTPLITTQANNLRASTITRMTQQHHHEISHGGGLVCTSLLPRCRRLSCARSVVAPAQRAPALRSAAVLQPCAVAGWASLCQGSHDTRHALRPVVFAVLPALSTPSGDVHLVGTGGLVCVWCLHRIERHKVAPEASGYNSSYRQQAPQRNTVTT